MIIHREQLSFTVNPYALVLALLLITGYPLDTYALQPCGDLAPPGQYGPYDYTNPADRKNHLPIVEKHHFTPEIENTTVAHLGSLIGDLDYTLRAFPNHHRALYSVSRLERRLKGSLPQPPKEHGWRRSAECYFKRAIRFRPKDPTVHMIFGIHLHLTGKLDEALEEYKISEQIDADSADLQYNLGLLYFERKEYYLSKKHAKKAYKLGHRLPGLRKKLASVDQWP